MPHLTLRPLIAASEMPHTTPGLPSWAIDFACSNRLGPRQDKWWRHSDRFTHYLACGLERLSMSVIVRDEALALTGVFVDEVFDVAPVYEVDEEKEVDDDDLRKAILVNSALLELHRMPLSDRYVTGVSVKDAFWRTMIGDLITNERPIRKPQWYDERDFDQYLQDGTQSDLNDALYGMIPNHAFFITTNGYMGVGPPDAQPGDQVWIFEGDRLPFVIRNLVGSEMNEKTKFSLIGDTYVHGIMNGEVLWKETRTIWII